MKTFYKIKSVISIFILLIAFSCKEDTFSYDSNLDKIESSNHYFGESLSFEIKEKNQKINSVQVLVNDKKIKGTSIKLDSLNSNYGANFVTININYGENQTFNIEREFNIYSSIKEVSKTYKIIQEYPHDPKIFTQGIEFNNGILYESAGQYKESKVVKHTLENIKPIKEYKNDDSVFGEGLTLFNGKIYQLSWQNHKAFVFNSQDLTLEKELNYPIELKTGWGICTDEKKLFISSEDNNPSLAILDENFKFIKTIPVVGNKKMYVRMNELEYANNKIYSNIWRENIIITINSKTGQVLEIYDFSDLANKNQTETEDVLNGIAHISGNTFLITGKNWKTIYKVEM